MKRQAILIPMFLALAVLGWSAPAAAQEADFTISVPVELHSLHPDITGFHVLCGISAGAQGVGNARTPEIALDPDGNYLGPPIIVEITLPDVSVELKSAASSYNCGLRLHRAGGTFRPTVDAPEEYQRPRPGTTFINDSNGTIVQGG